MLAAVAVVTSLCATSALSKPHHRTKPAAKPAATAPVTVKEAKAFNRAQEALNQRNDRRMLKGYRSDSQLMLWLTAGEEPVRALLTGKALFGFLAQAVAVVEEVPTATSCAFTERPDGQVLESCASINAARPTPTFSLSLIGRDRHGLAYKTVFVTDSPKAAQLVQFAGSLAPMELGNDESDEGSTLPQDQGYDGGMVRPPQ